MQVTIDKFGRILIPKKIRELFGLVAGQSLHLEVIKEATQISLSYEAVASPILLVTAEGIPTL